MIKIVLQFILLASISLAAGMIMGIKVYLGIEVVLTLVATGCMLAVPGWYDEKLSWWRHAKYIGKTFCVAAFLAAMWPGLPLIVGWGAVRSRDVAASSRTSDLRVP